MKKMTKLLLTLLPIISLTSCGEKYQSLEKIQKAGKIIVATNAEFAPFEYVENNKVTGFDIELIEAYAKSINVECEVVNQDFDAALLSVSTGKADVAIAAITKNSKRETSMGFSDTYYTANQVLIVKEDSIYSSLTTKEDILSALTANKAKIGFQAGTTGEYYVKGDADWGFDGITDAQPASYTNGALAVKALTDSKIDAVLIDIEPAKCYCEKYTGVKYLDVIFTEEQYAIAAYKGNDSLINSINEFITKSKEDGSFVELVKKYFGN